MEYLRQLLTAAVLLSSLLAQPLTAEENARPSARDLGLSPGVLRPGPLNAITDVDGVRVGHDTLIEGDSVRTGVTAIVPHGGNLFQSKAPAGVVAGNAFGKAAGFLQVRELGTLETPIVLTNTLCVGTAVRAVVDWTLARPGNQEVRSVNAVVGETNDGFLNDIRHCAVESEHVVRAIEGATGGPVAEGSVGAGTGTGLFGWKGGIGTASRVVPRELGGFTVGALVQANFGGVLTVDGMRVGEALGRYSFRDQIEADRVTGEDPQGEGAGSCMIVLATDAPLDPRNLERLARRALLGLARTGSFMHHGSGDFVIAFSNRNRVEHGSGSLTRKVELLEDRYLGVLFLAAVEAVEEAVLNALLRATTVTGHEGHTLEAFPVAELEAMLERRSEAVETP